jgi:hypothetical protein
MMAMARYFALYLQEKGKLVDAYTTVRDLKVADIQGHPGDHVVRLMEQLLGSPIDAVDRDFQKWYRAAAPAQNAKPK